jgi:ElaB/YqjD/DUF883 family membrane-anchored ribosome-binding protein
MMRKILAALLLVCAGFGLILCVAGLFGAWIANEPATNAMTAAIETVEGYLGLAGATTTTASAQVDSLHTIISGLETRVSGMTAQDRAAIAGQIRDTVQTQLGPTIKTLRTTLSTVRSGLIALNTSLVAANRIPGVNLPTFTDELQAVDQQLSTVTDNLTALVASVGDVSVDGSKVEALLASTSEQLGATKAALDRTSALIATGSTQIAGVGAAAPGLIDLTSVTVSLLALLFGAGQLSLILKSWAWLKAA